MKQLLLLFITIALAFAALSCAIIPPSVTNPFLSFTDDVGADVTLSKKPQRVAVLFSSLADVWVSAGGEVAITVGESVERGFAAADAVLVDAGAGKSINVELLVAAQPDFVICSSDVEKQVQAASLLNKSGIPAACFRIESFSDYLRVLKICTDMTENDDAYRKNGTEVKMRIDAMLASLPTNHTAPKILFARAGASFVKAKTASLHFAAAMLEELGAVNIADDAPILLDGLNDEILVQQDPDLILISTMGSEAAAKEFIARQAVWQTLSAVRNEKCFYLPKELFQYKPNARWDEAYRYLIDLLYET